MDFFATLLGDQAAALVVGAFLLATYQAAKFAELDVADPITSRYVARFPGVKAKDFVGAHTYRLALLAFLAVSLLLYFAACQISAPNSKWSIKDTHRKFPTAAERSLPSLHRGSVHGVNAARHSGVGKTWRGSAQLFPQSN